MGAVPGRSRGARGAAALTAALAAATAWGWGAGAEVTPARDGLPPSPQRILAQCFESRYELNLSSNIELRMSKTSGEKRRRVFKAASKIIEDRMHSLGRIVWPHHLRGMSILTIEAPDRRHDSFVYMPSLGKVRRISTAQRSDSFLGSDVTYEDLERRHPDDFQAKDISEVRVDGELAWQIDAVPNYPANYERVTFFIAQEDKALLMVHYFKWDRPQPYREVKSKRSAILVKDGHIVPTHYMIHDHIRRTSTEVIITGVVINPEISDRLFTVSTLEREHATILLER